MPTNRRDIPRVDRINAILDVATRLFLERGYNETTVGDVARQAGIRNGTVHWYFAGKDDLLAAVMARAIGLEFERASSATDLSPRDRLIMFLTGLRPFRELSGTLRERSRASEAVGDTLRQMDARTRELMEQALDGGDSWCDQATATDIMLAAFYGNSLAQEPRMYATDMVVFLLDQVFLVSEPSARRATAPATTRRTSTPRTAGKA